MAIELGARSLALPGVECPDQATHDRLNTCRALGRAWVAGSGGAREAHDFAPLLGLWMGLTAIIPSIGAWLDALPAFFLGLIASPLQALAVGALCMTINAVDGNHLISRLQGKAIGAPPVVVIVAVLGDSWWAHPRISEGESFVSRRGSSLGQYRMALSRPTGARHERHGAGRCESQRD